MYRTFGRPSSSYPTLEIRVKWLILVHMNKCTETTAGSNALHKVGVCSNIFVAKNCSPPVAVWDVTQCCNSNGNRRVCSSFCKFLFWSVSFLGRTDAWQKLRPVSLRVLGYFLIFERSVCYPYPKFWVSRCSKWCTQNPVPTCGHCSQVRSSDHRLRIFDACQHILSH